MKTSHGSSRYRAARTEAARRAQLLAVFAGSGLPAAAFARQQGLNYTPFCGWRQRQTKPKASPGFIPVELPTSAAPTELMLEFSTGVRLRRHCLAQLELAARRLHTLRATAAATGSSCATSTAPAFACWPNVWRRALLPGPKVAASRASKSAAPRKRCRCCSTAWTAKLARAARGRSARRAAKL